MNNSTEEKEAMKQQHSEIKINHTEVVDEVVVATGTVNGESARFEYDSKKHRFSIKLVD